MKPVYTAAEIKKRERNTIEGLGIPAVVLMERAAMFVCSLIHETPPQRILVLCGYGNNGADGLAAARILKKRGYQVQAVLIGDEKKSTPENILQRHILQQLGIPVLCGMENVRCINLDQSWDIIIDAIFGIGVSRRLQGEYLEAVQWINDMHEQKKGKVLSVDLPSGLHADLGRIMGAAVKADLTASFEWWKAGMLLGDGPCCCGRVEIGEIGIYGSSGTGFLLEKQDLKMIPERMPAGNKSSFGKILSITGSEKMAGAMVLSTQAAFRSGAGMVRVLSHKKNRQVLLSSAPEAVFDEWDALVKWDGGSDVLNEALLRQYFEWSSVLLIGCGLSQESTAELLTQYVVSHYDKILVADGDALNLISRHIEWLKERKDKGYPTILTPHPVEFSRLCGVPVEENRHRDMDYCMKWAKEHGCILVVKDAVTMVTDGGRLYFSNSGSDALATAGSGDVLAGMVTAFAVMGQKEKQKNNLLLQTALAVFAHGKTGIYAAEAYHHFSVKAGDLPDMIPKVFAEGGV